MSELNLRALLDAVAGVPVACLGDVMLDRYVYGRVERISPEAPIPVLLNTSRSAMLGAAGNVARNVAALGGRAHLAGHVGDDAAGAELLALVEDEPGITASLTAVPGGVTTVKTRFVAGGQQLLRVDDERPTRGDGGLSGGDLEALRDGRAVLVSDHAKGIVGESMIAAALAAGRERGVPVLVDPKGHDFHRYGPVDVLKPNAGELAGLLGMPTATDAQVEDALGEALRVCPARAILVTRAGAGMSLAERGAPVRHFRGRAREVFDVSGAGDTSLAALGLALAAGAPLEIAVEFAVLASGVVVGKRGTAVVTPEELIEAEAALHGLPAMAEMASLERAAVLAERWRGQGLRVGFTNGCFDILHLGHVAYLAQARAWCDRLVVGLNNDVSVRALKGEGRPVNALEDRARVLAGLSAVDLVVPFGEPTPLALIQAIRPDVLVKGADYAIDEVVGADLVEGWGGEVRLAPLVEGRSTSAVIARLAGQG